MEREILSAEELFGKAGDEEQRHVGIWNVAVGERGGLALVGDALAIKDTGFSFLGEAFVLLLDAAGERLWLRLLAHSAPTTARTLAIGPEGEIAVGGGAWGEIEGAERTGAFVWMLEPSGATRWVRHLGILIDDLVTDVAFDGDGYLMVAGRATIQPDGSAFMRTDDYVWKLDATGEVLFAEICGDGSRCAELWSFLD